MTAAAANPVDAREDEGAPTPLQRAIMDKDLARVKELVAQGASLSATTPAGKEDGKNAFHYAAESTPEIMEFLLQQRAADAARAFFSERGRQSSALRLALGNEDRRMTELLLDYGIPVNERDDINATPLQFLLGHRRSREGAMPLVRLLIDRGADLDDKAADYWNETPLTAAVRDSFTEGVTLLLDLGADATRRNQQDETLAHLAAENYDVRIMRMLLDHGADIGARNRQGRTPLHVAAHANRLDVVKLLLESGADPFAKDARGKTPDELCPADFQKNVHREILRKQMEVEAREMTRGGYYARQRAHQNAQQHTQQQGQPHKNLPFRPRGNGR